eukprot:m.133598 g.133598  ORF g.133598 m.133598 type:complete len:502 (-) comp20103_c1_seq5:38-1543(-)
MSLSGGSLRKMSSMFRRDSKDRRPSVPEGAGPVRVGSLSVKVHSPDTQSPQDDFARNLKHLDNPEIVSLLGRLDFLNSELQSKQSRLRDCETREAFLISKLTVADVAVTTERRMSLNSRAGSRRQSVSRSSSSRRDSGGEEGFGFGDSDEDAEDGETEILWSADQDVSNGELDDDEGPPDGTPRQYSMLGSGLSGSSRLRQRTLTSPAATSVRPRTASSSSRRSSRSSSRLASVPSQDALIKKKRDPRNLMLVRREPGEDLGFSLQSICLPKKDHQGHITNEVYEPSFISAVVPGGIAHQVGLQEGDEILEVDSQQCSSLQPAQVKAAITRNRGTLNLVVRYTHDFKRALLHKKLIELECEMEMKVGKLADLDKRERALLDAQAAAALSSSTASAVGLASSPEPDDGSLADSAAGMGLSGSSEQGGATDWCTASASAVLKLCGNDAMAVAQFLQSQWKQERAARRGLVKLQAPGETETDASFTLQPPPTVPLDSESGEEFV